MERWMREILEMFRRINLEMVEEEWREEWEEELEDSYENISDTLEFVFGGMEGRKTKGMLQIRIERIRMRREEEVI